MRAIVQDTYGSAEVLKLAEIDRPEIRDDELLIRVEAAGLDRGVWHVMVGLPYLIRIMGYGLRRPRTHVPGYDFAGRVAAIGKDVSRFQVGDEVFGVGRGSFAEYVSARDDRVEHRPANLTCSVGNRFSAEWVLGAVSWLKSGAGRPVRGELLPASRAR